MQQGQQREQPVRLSSATRARRKATLSALGASALSCASATPTTGESSAVGDAEFADHFTDCHDCDPLGPRVQDQGEEPVQVAARLEPFDAHDEPGGGSFGRSGDMVVRMG